MKHLHSILAAIVAAVTLSLSSVTRAAEVERPPAAATQQPASSASPNLASTRDAFLAFALEKAKSYTGKAEVAVSKAVDAVSEETPIAAREFLVWRAWSHGLNAIAPMLLTVGMFVLFYRQFSLWEMDSYSNLTKGTSLQVILTIIGGMGAFVGFMITCLKGFNHLMSFIQILVAPRIYVIEQVMNLFGK